MTSLALIDESTGLLVTSDDAWERHRRIVELRNGLEESFLALGEELYWMEAEKQYEQLGYATFNAYLEDPEVNIGRSTAFNFKRVFQRFILELKSPPGGLLPVGNRKLELLAPHVTEENIDEWLEKAARISRAKLKKELEAAFPSTPSPALPDSKYAVIYADPPWSYSNSGFDESAASQYPTMKTEDICALPVERNAADTTVLFMWATNPLLEDALKVLNAWGFDYKTNIAWVKDRGRGKGWFLKSRHELLLIGTRGSTPHPEYRPDSCFMADRLPKHSKKPEEAYLLIEKMYPGGPYIELFARNLRPGWDSWGDEVPDGES